MYEWINNRRSNYKWDLLLLKKKKNACVKYNPQL